MARPNKKNADWYPHDNHMRDDKKIKAVRRKFKHDGYSIYNMLLETLSEAQKIQIEYTDLEVELLAADFEIELELFKEILAYFAYLDLIQINNFIRCRQLDDRLKSLFDARTLNLEDLRKENDSLDGVSGLETTGSDSLSSENPPETHILEESIEEESIEEEIREDKSIGDKAPEPTPKKAIIYPSLPEVLTYFIDCARKEFTNINTEAVETEAKLYHSIRTGDKWVKANKKKVKNWKLDARQWILSKRSKLIDYDQKKSTRLLPSNDTAAFIEGVKTW